jgi:uncharacterized membrane protein YoaK (UPF0700 family)
LLLNPAPDRNLRQNVLLAVALAWVAGAVNSVGFLMLGAFTSHITGTATNLGGALGTQRGEAALEFAVLLGSFLGGAFAAGMMVEAARRLGRARYALGLATEAALLLTFVSLTANDPQHPRVLALCLLCLAMGLQNALGTSVSAAMVRATHLTGLMTDLGLEAARLLVDGDRQRSVPRLTLQTVTFCGFLAGAASGAAGHVEFGALAALGPVGVLLGLTAMDAVLYWGPSRVRGS